MTTPTPEGLRRYSETGGYQLVGDLPCVCSRFCQPRCAGECGCEACRMTFTVFCDEAGLGGFEPWTDEDHKNALAIYRDTSTPFTFHPSLEGFKRYPDTNGRYQGNPDLPCKCAPLCARPCDGACGCSACETAHESELAARQTLGPDGQPLPSVAVLSTHRRR